METMTVYRCPSCSGEINFDSDKQKLSCPYCNSPVNMNKNISDQLKPDYVIPFKLMLKQNYKNFLKINLFCLDSLKKIVC